MDGVEGLITTVDREMGNGCLGFDSKRTQRDICTRMGLYEITDFEIFGFFSSDERLREVFRGSSQLSFKAKLVEVEYSSINHFRRKIQYELLIIPFNLYAQI